VEHIDRGLFHKRCLVRKYLNKILRIGFTDGGRSRGSPPPNRVVTPAASLLRPTSRLVSLPWKTRVPHGLSGASERPIMVLLPGRPPRAPTPAANSNPPVPSSPPKYPQGTGPARRHYSILGVSSLENKNRTSRLGDLGVGVHKYLQKLSVPSLPDIRQSRGSQLPESPHLAPNRAKYGTAIGLPPPTTRSWG
jgi:hypothetical protein